MNILILNYTGNDSNWGCQATSKNIITLLNRTNNISLEYIEIEDNGSKYRKLLSKLRFEIMNRIINDSLVKFFTNIFKYIHPLEMENINKIDSCDILILNGEGSLHGYNNELMKFIQYLMYAKKLAKSVYIINHSLQFDNDDAKKFLKILYKYSDKNYFREKLSYDNSKVLNIKNCYIVPDAAFLNYYINTDKVELKVKLPSKYILASGSIILSKNNTSYFKLLKKLQIYYELPVIFIASCNVDKSLKELVTKKYGFIYLDDKDLSVDQVQKLIKNSDFFYSGRFHLNIFAATVGKIFIPFKSNTIKMQGFLNLIDYPLDEIDIDSLNQKKEFEKIIHLMSQKKEVETRIYEKTAIQVKNLENAYKDFLI